MRCMISSRNKPLHHYHSRYAHWTLSRPIPTRHLGGNRVKWNHRLQLLLLRRDQSVNKVSALHFTQNTLIYSWNKPLNCYHGGYTYRLITMPFTLWTTCRPKWHYFEKQKWRFVVSSRNKLLSQGCIHYIRFDIRTNKPLNSFSRFSLPCIVSIQNWP